MKADETFTVPSKFRTIKGKWRAVSIGVPAIAIVVGIIGVFHLRPFGLVMLDVAYLYLLVAIFLPLCFLWIPVSDKAKKDRVSWYDMLIMMLSCGIPLYFFFEATEIIRGWAVPSIAPWYAMWLSVVMWALVVEAARRAVGWVFAAVVLFFSTYPLFGDFMPGMLYAKRFAFDRLSLFHILGEDSVMGIPLHVFGRLFFGYMIFALGLQAFGIGRFFNEVAVAFLGRTRGGNAKVAIVASALFGSISGHPGANIFATGSFTIPAMKKEGFSAEFAGAVEATASTGGVIMPPVMGAVAFIMAEFIEVSYATVCLAAIVPSLLYYLCLFAQIDAYSARHNLKPSTLEISVPPIWKTILNNFHIIIGFAFLLYLLFYMRLEAWAPWFATGLTFLIASLTKRTRIGLKEFARFLEDSGRTLGQMMGIMAPVGMIIGSLILAGIAYSMPYAVVKLAGDNRYLLLVFGAMASFVLGMGVSITACYIFLAIVLAPGLVMAKFDILASHMFVLYCGLWSFITPPVCLSAFTAAIIAGGNAMKTAFISMRLGMVTFFVPFFFVLKPALILRGPPFDIISALATSIPGVILMSGAIEGYIWYLGKVGIVTRLLIFASGFLMAIPESNTDTVGIAVAVIVIAVILIRKKIVPTRDARGI